MNKDSTYTAIFNDLVDFIYDRIMDVETGLAYSAASKISDYNPDWSIGDGRDALKLNFALNSAIVKLAELEAEALMYYYE